MPRRSPNAVEQRFRQSGLAGAMVNSVPPEQRQAQGAFSLRHVPHSGPDCLRPSIRRKRTAGTAVLPPAPV